MRSLKGFLALSALILSSASMANVVGLSTHPFTLKNKVLTTEFTSNLSHGSGFGVQARYNQKLNQELTMDAGFGLAGGERDSKMFVGADYMLFPDYHNQPRVSMKATYERLSEFNVNYHALGLTPTLSKGVTMGGNEVFPFVAIPVKLALDSNQSRYETISSLAFGMTGRLPIEGYRNLVGNIEANLDIDNSYTGLFMGVSYPIE